MPISYKNKIYTTLGTPTVASGSGAFVTNSVGVPAKDYTVKGKSIVWNQMLQNPDFSNTVVDTRKHVSFLVQQLASPYEVFFLRDLQEPGLVSGVFTIPVSGKCRIKHNGSVSDIDFFYFTSVKNHKYYIYINFTSINPSVVGGVTYDKAQFFDLTQMFGAGNEPTTPAEFWQRVPEKLYGYNPNDYKSANIPSSKYFPDGMRSAGSAYDEINFLSQKAIKRIGVVDLGTLNWGYISGDNGRFTASVDGIKIVPQDTKGNLVCSKYTTASIDDVYLHTADKTIAVHYELPQVWVYDSSYTDAAAFKAAMSGVMLYYELATPVETAITPPLQALSTSKGFTSFSAPNSLMQNGPLSVTYYAEGGTNPESGWLTSYRRKLYMGRNIEWNQLLQNPNFSNTVVDTRDLVDFRIRQNISPYTDWFSLSFSSPTIVNAFFMATSTGYGEMIHNGATKNIWFNEFVIVKSHKYYATLNFTSANPLIIGGVAYNKAQLFDLTLMFGAGNEPTTPAEFWSHFGRKYYPYNAGESQPLFLISRKSITGRGV